MAVYNRTRAKAEPLGELGAVVVDRPADLADRDIVFTMVAGSDDFKAVVVGENGLLSRPDAAPAVIVDSSTVSPTRPPSPDRGASDAAWRSWPRP